MDNNKERTTERIVNQSFPEVKETDVNRGYEGIEHYKNMSSSVLTQGHEKDVSPTQNQAYASIKHS